MKLYRIYAEHKNYDDVMEILRRGEFSGFTVHTPAGYFGTKREHALVIDIVTDDQRAVENAAYAIKKHNKQKEVLVVIIPCEVRMI